MYPPTSALVVLYGDTIFAPEDFKVCSTALAKLLSCPAKPLERMSMKWNVNELLLKYVRNYIHTSFQQGSSK